MGRHLSEIYFGEEHIVYWIDNLNNGKLKNNRTLLNKKNFKFIYDDIRNPDVSTKIPNDLIQLFI